MKILNIVLLSVAIISTNASSIESNSTVESDNSDNLNSCLGISKKNLKYCSRIKDRDKKSSCFGIVKRNSGYCNMVKNENLKNRCLSIALSDIEYCDKIKDKDLKEGCKSLYKEIESESKQEDCE